jgi:glycerophosphoryl diester phosphodiesterase
MIRILAIVMMSASMAAAQKRVEIEAHRGESFIAPENTLASFNLAWKNNDDAIELDIHLTKDGQLIVCHDFDTHRTGGEKLVIKEHTLEELRRIDVGKFKDAQYTGEKMPLLKDVIATVPAGKRVFVEIKTGPEAAGPLEQVVRASGKDAKQVVIISFHADALAASKKLMPEHKHYFLSGLKQDKQTKAWSPTVEELIKTAKEINADGLDIQFKEPLNQAFVKKAKDAGLEFYAWTVDDPSEARKLLEYGVDGITTNRAAWLRDQLGGTP